MRTVVLTLLVLGLAGCAGLPAPPTPESKFIALELKTATTAGGWPPLTLQVNLRHEPQLVSLRSGINFIPVPVDVTEIRITQFRASGTANGKQMLFFTKSLDISAELSGGSVTLLPWVFSYEETKRGRGFSLDASVLPMTTEHTEDILKAWKKEDNAARWASLTVAGL